MATKKQIIHFARDLRKNQTFAESIMWQLLRNRKIEGFKFNRQFPFKYEGVGNNNYKFFIADFYCNEKKLIIEIDGSSHDSEEAKINDEIRQERLESLGVRFLRFTDADVKRNMEMVLNSIDHWIDEQTHRK